MSDAADPLLWSVDRSWGNVRANQDGSPFPSARTKYHVDRGDSTAKCSRRILLNSIDNTRPIGFGGEIYPDQPIGRVSEVEAHSRDLICRRCVPKPTDSGKNCGKCGEPLRRSREVEGGWAHAEGARSHMPEPTDSEMGADYA